MYYAAHTHAYSHNIIHTCTPQAHARSDTHVRVHVRARMGVSERVLLFCPLCVCVELYVIVDPHPSATLHVLARNNFVP
jgi:hypothetical protein